MTKLTPVNNHILVEPVKREGFLSTTDNKYQEIGVVLTPFRDVKVGDRVYFDAWLAKKYPKPGSTDDYYWLVNWDNVTAIEHVG